MSLDVYLVEHPCDHCGRGDEVFGANITHNLTRMAAEAGIYEAVWRPDEYGFTRARQVGEAIRAGLARMASDPDRFRAFDAENGWGTFDQFVPWLESYAGACELYPDARVRVSR